ncbi:siderophore-interacting protein [uncultured Actinomyces sp.]|uniref:siderophore-interacting protein n=1 Tax=uncultured Actinomyces sp. TaxID=249061 RepID=UPI0028D41D37|nr:siderophore-interacting protein [uncultured Actinomyces sp.]
MSPARPSASPTSPFRFFHVTVAAVRDVTPSMRRFTFIGDDLIHYADPGWDQRIKLVLPAPASGYERLPDGEDWYGRLMKLPEEHRCSIRTYTTRSVHYDAPDPGSAAGTRTEVNVDMVVHDPLGPAARWVLDAVVGTRAVLLGPNRQWDGDTGGVDFVPPQVTERFLLGGDETAAPAIARILEDLPASARGVAVVEMPSDADAPYLPTHPGIEVRVTGREGRAHGEVLTEGVRRAAEELCPMGVPQEVEEIDVDRELLWDVPRHAKGGNALKRTTLYAWLAGEAAAVRTMRRYLVSERGIDRRSVAFMGYWRQGRAEG